MSNKVKFFHSGMVGAPVVLNSWGDLTSLLDACLVSGFNLRPVSGVTRDGDIATLNIGSGHGFIENQVVLVSGCDQVEYNGEFTVIGVTATTVDIAVAGEPVSPATTKSSITVKVAPLGFETVFSGTNKRVYRSKNHLSNRHFLRVDDSCPAGYTTTWAKFARVSIAENMLDIDTFSGPRAPYDPALPTKNEVPSGSGTAMYSGWFKWYFSRLSYAETTGDNGTLQKSWCVIGDDRGFFFPLSQGWAATDRRVLCAFNDFDSFKSGDGYSSFLFASERYLVASNNSGNGPYADAKSACSNDATGKICIRRYTQVGDNAKLGMLSLNDGNSQNISGRSGNIPFPNGPDYSLIIHPVYLRELQPGGGDLRGIIPGLFWIHHSQPYSHLSIVDHVAGYPGRKFLIFTLDYEAEGNTSAFACDITGPWR